MSARSATILTAALLCALPALAQDDEDPRIKPALEKAMAYLQGRQAADGSFQGEWAGKDYRTGETALSLLALLKAGVEPDAPAIERGFAWLMAQPHQRIYCVSLAVLALEARYTPPPQASIKADEPLATQIRGRFKGKAPDRDRRWLATAVAFLQQHQDGGGLWRYPFFGEADLSNTQFAVLALKAADRMGARVEKGAYLGVVDCLLKSQEASGPEVSSFAVPAADQPIAGLLDKREQRRPEGRGARSSSGGTRTRVADEEELITRARTTMKARGWGYRAGLAPRGSMTAAGLAVLVVCKSELEGNKLYDKQLAPAVDQALRDGAAWLATRFRADRNPGAENDWLFYYLYTLERAGTLLALNRFGERDWYAEGAQTILASQQGDGRFTVGTGGEQDGEVVSTCFGILFLKRSTVPVIKRPKTGGDVVYGGGAVAAGSGGGPLVERLNDGTLSVTFSCQAAPGRRVCLAGSFNGWSVDAQPLQDVGGGLYKVTLTLPKGRHSYKFVLDGAEWRQDPSNPKSEPDGHGGRNSILEEQ